MAKVWRELYDDAAEKLDLAQTYLEDGAPRSAARCYREAADLLDQMAGTRDAEMAERA